ncbi:hypothetical protein FDECE_11885 [Fusarium decemcellulare]|nr:hypothetical protein FDECE_11885 [Fusarium decemcellulare]
MDHVYEAGRQRQAGNTFQILEGIQKSALEQRRAGKEEGSEMDDRGARIIHGAFAGRNRPTKSEDGRRAKLREEYRARLYASLPASGSPSISSHDDPEKKLGKRLRDEDSSDEESSQAKRRLSFSTIYIRCPAA